MKPIQLIICAFVSWSLLFFPACSKKDSLKQQKEDSLYTVFNKVLKENILSIWYPKSIDTIDGGYLSNFSYNWKPDSSQPKMLVSQSRHIWTCSNAFQFYKDSSYLKIAKHGVSFLIHHLWDSVNGGFFNIRSKKGGYYNRLYKNEKRAYGNSFAIYALSAYYKASKEKIALEYAQKAFNWLIKHSYDEKKGGYIDAMNQDGSWFPKDTLSKSLEMRIVTWKDYNSSIHLLESFTELYKIWKNNTVKKHLQELLFLIRDKFVTRGGYLTLYFTKSWKPITTEDSTDIFIRNNSIIDHISFGHDVETAFLMLEAEEALGVQNDRTTLKVAKKMVDHALATGFDKKYGGFFNEGYYFKNKLEMTITNTEKVWWVQAEGLNSLLLMSKIFPKEKKYYKAFLKQWNNISSFLIDWKYGEWYWNGLDYNPEYSRAPKANIWKVNYHNGRALMNCMKMLKNEFELVERYKTLNNEI